MKIKLKSEFINGNSEVNSIKYLKNMSSEEKELFFNFLKDILNNVAIYGKNKSSAKLPSVKNHENLQNFAIFLNNSFYHYHLGIDSTMNPRLRYSFDDSRTLVAQEIINLNDEESSGKFKSCDNLVNYQMIDNEIIIYNISIHGAWTELVYNLCEKGISLDYTTCESCHEVITDNNVNCLCLSSVHTNSINVSDSLGLSDYVEITLIRGEGNVEKVLVENLKPYIKGGDITILSLEDLDNFISTSSGNLML